MNVSIKIVKDIPKEKIYNFEDRVIYNTAILTREYTKGMNAYPYLTGELERQEIKAPITGGNKEYNLIAGTNYAKYVWKMNDVTWTNSSTNPQWYYSIFRKKEKTIITKAVNTAMKEI